jgi:hypothetical protein
MKPVLPAARYNNVPVGSKFAYLFETQDNIPIDGSNALARNLSPFQIRIIPPEALTNTSTDPSVNLLSRASRSNATRQQSNATRILGRDQIPALQSFVSSGQFFLNQSNPPYRSTLVNEVTAADIYLQLNQMINTPPLTLLINPSEMTISHEKVQTYESWTRYGGVYEIWGEQQVKISFSGSTGGFIAGSADGVNTSGQTNTPSGYQTISVMRDSAAWQNFQALYLFYRNNGTITDRIGQSEANHFMGSLAIDYDQWTYIGQMESFSFGFEAESPHRVTFEMEFTASQILDNHQATSVVQPLSIQSSGSKTNNRTSGSLSTRAGVTDILNSDLSQIPFDLLGG